MKMNSIELKENSLVFKGFETLEPVDGEVSALVQFIGNGVIVRPHTPANSASEGKDLKDYEYIVCLTESK